MQTVNYNSIFWGPVEIHQYCAMQKWCRKFKDRLADIYDKEGQGHKSVIEKFIKSETIGKLL